MNHSVQSYDTEAPSNLDVLLGMVSKTAEMQSIGCIQSISIRMPLALGCTFEAMAQHSGQSRNKLIVKALEVAVDALYEQMPEAERQTIERMTAKLIGERLEAKDTESGEV